MVNNAIAQRPDLQPPIGSSEQDTIEPGIMPLDTPATVSYVLLEDESKLFTQKDSFSWEDARHDPLGFGFAHLGNMGSAARALRIEINPSIGFNIGQFQFDPYLINQNTFRYYNQAVPVTKIKYSQSGKDDTYVKLDFGRSFSKGFNLSLHYSRINQVGEFAHQQQKNTSLGIGVWHDAPSGKYDAFYNLISNSVQAQENGGVVEPDSIGKEFNPDNTLPTFISEGITTHKHRVFLTKQIIHLLGDSASIGIDLWLKAKFQTGQYKYVDEDALTDSVYYGAFLTDDRGIRQYTFVREHEESFGMAMPWKALHSTVSGSIRYRGITLDQEPERRNLNELYFESQGEFQWVEPLRLKGDLSIGLGKATGNYRFSASAELNTSILGVIKGHWRIQSRQPYLFESKLYVSQIQVYSNSFRNPFSSEVGVEWDFPKQDLKAGLKWVILDDYIYFESNSRPAQLDNSFSVNQLYVVKGFDFKWIGVKFNGVWQPDANEILAIPETMMTGSLYGRINMIRKKLTVVPYVDMTWYSEYAGSSYFPVNGVYYLTGKSPIPDYFRIDVGLGTKINFLKAFVRLEDISGLIERKALHQADFYPHYRGYFRIGAEAGFYN